MHDILDGTIPFIQTTSVLTARPACSRTAAPAAWSTNNNTQETQ
jgi:hypothetical protein